MTDPANDVVQDADTPSDAELISRVRGGDVTAFGELFARHRDAANRLARQLVRGPDSDDLVAEAFAKVLTVLQGGGGPDVAFRAYLLTAVRRLHIDRVRSGQRLQTTDDMTKFDPGVPFQDTAVAGFENGAAARAFASLPERWQLVLWHLEVERNKPADIAPLLGMSPNSVSALAYRAREGLRQAFLTMHLSDISDTECRWVNEHLGAYVRKGLAKRDAGKVRTHLDGCRRCMAMYVELEDVNSNLAAIIAPLLLGTAAAGYLASVGTGATAVGAASGLTHLASRAKDIVVANTGAATAAGIAATVAAAAVVAVAVGALGGGDKPRVVADPGAGLSSSVPLDTSVPSVLGAVPLTPTTRPTPTPSPSPTPTGGATTTPGPTLSLAPSTLPTSPVFVAPPAPTTTAGATPTGSGTATGTPTATASSPGSRPTTTPSARPTTTPTSGPSPTEAAGDPGPAVVADPVLAADGSVRVSARNLTAQDHLDVVLQSGQTTFAPDLGVTGCRRVTALHVTCGAGAAARLAPERVVPADAGVMAPRTRLSLTLPLAFPDYMLTDDVTATVTVGDVSATVHEAAFHPSRTPSYDFAVTGLTASPQGVDGDTETYQVTGTLALPPSVDALTFALTGGDTFAAVQSDGCTVADDTHVRCTGLQSGSPVTFAVTSAATTTHDIGIGLVVPTPFEDPTTSDDSATVTVRPAAALHLAASDLGALHQDGDGDYPVSTAVTGVRAGLDTVRFGLSGGLSFAATTTAGCSVEADQLACTGLADGGPVAFTVRSATPATASDVTLTVTPGDGFEQLGDGNVAAGTLVPSYDFALGELTETGHTVSGDVDHLTLTGTVRALPAGLTSLQLTLEGGTVADQQGSGCTRVDDTTLTCTDLGADRAVDVHVDSTATTTHDVRISLQVPRGYDDPDPGDDTATASVAPAVDLALGSLTPRAPVPTAAGSYEVAGTLQGVRSGPVTLTVSGGATLTASSCLVTSGTVATCASPTDGQRVQLSLRPADPRASTAVTVHARAAAGLEELDDSDNSATATLAPDVTLGGLRQTADSPSYATVQTTVSGIPAGTTVVRLRVGGAAAGLGPDHVHLVLGADGADGEGPVSCGTTDAAGSTRPTGLYVSCDHLGAVTAGSFAIVARLAHPHGTPTPVTLTVLPVGVDQGPHTDDDTATLSIS